jgi:hypothetical protein
VIEGCIECLRGWVMGESQDVATPDAGETAGPGDNEKAQGPHAADQVRIGAFPGPGFGRAKVSSWKFRMRL